MKKADYNGFGGKVNAAKRQGDIAWGFQPQDLVKSGLRPEGAQKEIRYLIYRAPTGRLP